ncbi:MAG: hypothetical protein DMF62_14185 [Acidobacteria bacterium]|nr:MAG: hypothetical protein DMF62_14185 [Acidobacteriota bacterium]
MEELEDRIQSQSNSRPLIEGDDFYTENELIVLTEGYLRKRGYCCGNGCRHCPFDHANVPVDQSK